MNYIGYYKTLPLIHATFHMIENGGDNETFFYLRERYRKECQN